MMNPGTQEQREERQPRGDGVAARSRWRSALFVPVLLALVLLLLSAPFFLFRIEPVRRLALDAARLRTGLGARFDISIERVIRFDPGGLIFGGMRLDARPGDGEWVAVAHATRIAARWSIRDILAGRVRILSLEAESLSVSLPALALLNAGEAEPGESRRAAAFDPLGLLPPTEIKALKLGPVELCDQQGVRFRLFIDVSEMQTSNEGFFARITQGHVADERGGLAIDLRGGLASMGADGVLKLSDLHLQTEGTRALLRAQTDLSARERTVRLFFDFERLDPGSVVERLGLGIPCEPGDSLSGIVELQFGSGMVLGDLALEGVLLGERLSEVSGLVSASRDTLRVSEAEIRGDVGRISASGWLCLPQELAAVRLSWEGVDPRSAWLPWLRHTPLKQRFSGSARADIDFSTPGAPVVAGAFRLRDARPWGVPTREIRFAGRVEVGDAVVSERLTCAFPRGRLSASGRWPLNDGTVDVTVEIDSLMLGLLPEGWRAGGDGNASGEFRLSGSGYDPVLEGVLQGWDLAWGNWRADSLCVDPLLLRPVALRGVGGAEFWGVSSGEHSAAHLHVGISRLREKVSVAARLDHSSAELSVHGDVHPAGWLELQRASLVAPHLGSWELARPMRAGWARDTLWADSLILDSGDARLSAVAHWVRDSREVGAHLELERFDVARLTGLLQGVDSLRGTCGMRLVVGGELPDPEVLLDFAYEDFRWGAIDLGRGMLKAAWRDSALRVGPVVLSGPGHRVAVPEVLLDAGHPLVSFMAGGADVAATIRDASWAGTVQVESLDLDQSGLLLGRPVPDGGAQAGWVESYHSVMGQIVPIRVIAPWDSLPGDAGGGYLGGIMSGKIALDGSLREPTLRIEAEIPGLSLVGVDLGGFSTVLTYADSLVTIERLRLSRDERTTWLRGYYPFHLSLFPVGARPLRDPVGIQMALDNVDLALLSGLTNWLRDASGQLSGQLAIGGTGVAPELRGTALLTDGGFRIPGRSERIYEADAILDVRRNGVRIRSLDARCGPRGTVTAVGTFDGPEDFDLSAHVENARILEEGRYEFLATADMHAYTSEGKAGEDAIPHLHGAIEIHSGRIMQNLAEGGGGSSSGPASPWVIDLDVEAPGNIRVSQAGARVDLGEGSLQLAYRWPYWNVSGTVRILGGSYRLLGNTFTITEGSLEFFDTGAGADVAVEIEAETCVTVASDEGGPSEMVTIEVHVHGKPEALEVDLSSQPPLSEGEIVELLSYGRFTRTGRFEPIAETQWILLNSMVTQLQIGLIDQLPFSWDMEIAAGASTEDPMRVTLRPVVMPGFMLNYSQDIAADPAGELLLDYRLSRMLFLRGGLYRQREGSGGLIDEYGLDLHCRFGYE
jgi:hypothetical protein